MNSWDLGNTVGILQCIPTCHGILGIPDPEMCTPVCRLCGRYLTILGRPIRVTVPAVTVAPTALVGSLIRSSNLPHSLQRGVLVGSWGL